MTEQTHKIAYLITAFENSAWMLEPGFYNRMSQVLLRRDAGVYLDQEEIAKIVPAAADGDSRPARPFAYQVIGNIAVVPICGVISKYSTLVERISAGAGCSCETIRNNFNKALRDDSVDTIILRVDSPGGSVAGIDDLAREIYQARGKKKIIALAEDCCASAAYYLASQAEKVYSNSSALVGSIGVIAGIVDSHRAYENQGFHVVTVKSSDNKGAGTQGTAITEQQQRQWKTTIMGHYDLFVSAVVRGRAGLTREGLIAVSEGADHIADGRVFIAETAKELGLIDEISTFEELTKSAHSPDGEIFLTDIGSDGTEAAGGATPNVEMKGQTDMADMADENKEKSTEVNDAVAERERCTKVSKVLAGEPELLEKAISDAECDETKAKAMLADTLQAKLTKANEENANLQKENADLKGLVKEPETSGEDLPPSERSDEDGPRDWKAAMKIYDAKYPKDPVKAQDEAMAAYPELYGKWRKDQGIDA